MLEHATGTVSFFQAMAPILIANVLTVTFVYSLIYGPGRRRVREAGVLLPSRR